MSSNIVSKATGLFDKIVANWNQAPRWAQVSTLLTVSTFSLLTANFFRGYRKWLAMGPGGLPYNLRGYLMNVYVETRYGSKNTKNLKVYEEPEKYFSNWSEISEAEKKAAEESFIEGGPLPRREGPETKAKVFAIPQREKDANDEAADIKVREAYLAKFNDIASRNASETEWRTSVLERRGQAVFLKPDIAPRPLAAQSRGEICHIHGSDLSGHVTLSFADAREVISKGWGERHRLSGMIMLPLGYTLLYVPRTVEECEILGRIFEAGFRYNLAGETA